MPNLISTEIITSKIFVIRGKKVILDRDLAQLYEVTTKRLNEQVKRNTKRLPEDFMFQLTPQRNELPRSKLRGIKTKFLKRNRCKQRGIKPAEIKIFTSLTFGVY